MLPGVTPAAAGDVGEADPAFAQALAAHDLAAVATLLPSVRLLVPVVAIPPPDRPAGEVAGEVPGEAEMAVPGLVNADGLRALPVFSSVPALAAWRAQARPVPMIGARVLQAAVEEGYDGLVVDVAGPAAATFDRAALLALSAVVRSARPPAGC